MKWLLGLFGCFLAASAGCVPGADDPKWCSSDNDCASGEVCGSPDCHTVATCLPAGCACVQSEFGYSVPGDACRKSNARECNCDHATCGNPRDSCGTGVCLGVCKVGESCAVCLDGKSCEGAEICASSYCIANEAGTEAVCRPTECAFTRLVPPLCGTPEAPCGEECCKPDCTDRVCGEDLRCGLSCGTCEPESFCTIEGRCQLDSGVSACAGDLRATPPLIQVESVAGDLPTPQGGTITDGTYDLVATRQYVLDRFADVYQRAALRFSASGTEVEQIYDYDPDYFADYDTPHRLLAVATESTVLHFSVKCPNTVISIYQNYDRSFTVQGSELWLFQPSLIEVYRARQ